MADDPAQLVDVENSILATRLLIDCYDATGLDDFEARIRQYVPDATRVAWFPADLIIPAGAMFLGHDGTLWILGAGDADYGQLLASFALSDPLDLDHPQSLVMAHAGLHAAKLVAMLHANGAYAGTGKAIWAGHSLGGASAAIGAASEQDTQTGLPPFQVITFGAPKPGDSAFKRAGDRLDVVRWLNLYDPVPMVPFNVGLITLAAFGPPASVLVGLGVGYKQLEGGRLLGQERDRWQSWNLDYGILNTALLFDWLVNRNFHWITAHSLLTYQELLGNVLGANSPNPFLRSAVGDTRSNKVAAPIAKALLCRIFGVMQQQGWSFNFYTNTNSYTVASSKCNDVAGWLLATMHSDAGILGWSVSDPLIVGDSYDKEIGQKGQLTGSATFSSPPNIAARILLKVAAKRRRVLWIHGLTSQIKLAGSGLWTAYGAQLTALSNFVNALMTGANPPGFTGLIYDGPGMWLRTINNDLATDRIGQILHITPDANGLAVVETDDDVTGLEKGDIVQIKGRTPLYGLRGKWPVTTITPPSTVTLNVKIPLYFVYKPKAYLWDVGYQYEQPDSVEFDGIATHRTGSPFGRLRGRAAAHR